MLRAGLIHAAPDWAYNAHHEEVCTFSRGHAPHYCGGEIACSPQAYPPDRGEGSAARREQLSCRSVRKPWAAQGKTELGKEPQWCRSIARQQECFQARRLCRREPRPLQNDPRQMRSFEMDGGHRLRDGGCARRPRCTSRVDSGGCQARACWATSENWPANRSCAILSAAPLRPDGLRAATSAAAQRRLVAPARVERARPFRNNGF